MIFDRYLLACRIRCLDIVGEHHFAQIEVISEIILPFFCYPPRLHHLEFQYEPSLESLIAGKIIHLTHWTVLNNIQQILLRQVLFFGTVPKKYFRTFSINPKTLWCVCFSFPIWQDLKFISKDKILSSIVEVVVFWYGLCRNSVNLQFYFCFFCHKKSLKLVAFVGLQSLAGYVLWMTVDLQFLGLTWPAKLFWFFKADFFDSKVEKLD